MDSSTRRRDLHVGLLKVVPAFANLSTFELSTLADAAVDQTFAAGDVIFKQGDSGDQFYLIKKGTVVCTQQQREEEDPVEIGRLDRGASFGQFALLSDRPRQATVTALGEVVCLILDRTVYTRLIGPQIGVLRRNMETYNTFVSNII